MLKLSSTWWVKISFNKRTGIYNLRMKKEEQKLFIDFPRHGLEDLVLYHQSSSSILFRFAFLLM